MFTAKTRHGGRKLKKIILGFCQHLMNMWFMATTTVPQNNFNNYIHKCNARFYTTIKKKPSHILLSKMWTGPFRLIHCQISAVDMSIIYFGYQVIAIRQCIVKYERWFWGMQNIQYVIHAFLIRKASAFDWNLKRKRHI